MADDRLDAIKAWLALRQSSDRASSVAEDEKVAWLVAQLEDARARLAQFEQRDNCSCCGAFKPNCVCSGGATTKDGVTTYYACTPESHGRAAVQRRGQK